MRLSLFFVLIVAATTSHADGWKLIQEIAAIEAKQAAAISPKFVYAIDNAHVAKYDRSNGRRLALSFGEAHHLNSGFFREGKIYCAHSNYPQLPERSEIKVLDEESMALTTFKDFGDCGGSLTWCVFEEGRWWCNFAKYGEQNAATFLVQFDLDWKELGRWTLPPELIRQLGSYSLSGGVWHNGILLVSGHDDPILFQLKLPQSGHVLELLGKEPAPITGQGFAIDPDSNELIGIHRAKRLIIFAKR